MNNILDNSIFTNKTKIFLVGAMGSGKTEIAINYSCRWSNFIKKTVGLVDLDMVKPYFKIRNFGKKPSFENVEIVASPQNLINADIPIISPQLEACIISPDKPAVIDVGGDDVGARLIGRYRDRLNPDNIEIWFVYNALRPFSRGEDDILDLMKAIETAGRFKITGIIHNSHLMNESSVEILKRNIESVNKLSKNTGIPILFHCIREDLTGGATKSLSGISIFPLKLYLPLEWF